MIHICPQKPCPACWHEACELGLLVVIFGCITLALLTVGYK